MKIRFYLISALLILALSLGAKAPKYIFYFIGDGMGHGAVALTNFYNKAVNNAEDNLLLMQFPVASAATTQSASSPVTDSAAAGTALATGYKTKNGMLGMDADSIPVTSIAKILFDKGYGIGLVTSVAPDDATPGAFYAHVPSRGMTYEIGLQAAESGYDFIAGSKLRGTKDKDGNPNDLLETFEKNKVSVVHGLDKLSAAKHNKIMLLNPEGIKGSRIGYVIDNVEGAMTLPAMTQACLDHLLKNKPNKFFMMVEGGAIDHAAHANDAASVVLETLAFDQSLAIAYDFYLKHKDETLIIVTADHETGGLICGNSTLYYNLKPEILSKSIISGETFSNYCKDIIKQNKEIDWDEMKTYLKNNFGLFDSVELTPEQEENLKSLFHTTFVERSTSDKKTLYNSFNYFSAEVFGLINKLAGVGWTTNYHSGTWVPVFATGQGAEQFNSLVDNTEIPKKIAKIAEVELK